MISQAMIDAERAVPADEPAWWQAEVVHRRWAAPDVAVLTLAPDRPYPFTPGQYLTLCSPRVPQVWRPYSIGCAPRADGTLEVHVRRVPDGLLSPVLVDEVLPGEQLRLGPALGTAVLDPYSRRPLLAVAGGSVSVKRGYLGGRLVTVQPEYDEAAAVARQAGLPVAAVIDQARARAEQARPAT